MLELQDSFPSQELERLRQQNATTILRVFNYYRVGLAFALLLVFVELKDQRFVGAWEPGLFRATILSYVVINVLVSLATLLMNKAQASKPGYMFTVLAADVLMVCLLMYSSGGVDSGLGNFIIFPVAFAGVLIYGRLSMVVAAAAVLIVFYMQSYLMMRSGAFDSGSLFHAGLLGIALFAINLLFQYVSLRLRRREGEVTTLQHLEQVRSLAQVTRDELDQSHALCEVLLNSAGQGVLGLDLEGHITFANPKAADILGYQSLAGHSISHIAPVTDDSRSSFQTSNILHNLDVASDDREARIHWIRCNGDSFPVEYSCEATFDKTGDVTGAVIIFQDVTERDNAQSELHRMANFDSLTGLANRKLFQEELQGRVSLARDAGTNFAVMLLDLDHFKCVNDQFGHDYGDELLVAASRRMRNCIREGDIVARLGGDEFAILVSGFATTENLALIAQNLVDHISRSYDIFDRQLRISTSIGLAVLDDQDLTSERMLKYADIALYAAKAAGRGCFHFHSCSMDEEAEFTSRIQLALQNAIEQDEFELHYQPIVSLDDCQLHHSEALLRWQPRGEDPISPDIFIPIAEETGKIGQIGLWVFKKALEQLCAWRDRHDHLSRIAVNVSTRQLTTSHFRESVVALLEKYDIPADAIELELTETRSMEYPETVIAELHTLKKLGMTICADDFGTGHSSLDYIRLLPLDQLKIDKCFIRGIGVDRQDEEIVKVILAIAKAMEIKVVAEGIENELQVSFLRTHGCNLGQGFYFARPVDSIRMDHYLDGEPLAAPSGNVSYLSQS